VTVSAVCAAGRPATVGVLRRLRPAATAATDPHASSGWRNGIP